jgi:cation-transporting ATPase 13A2
MGHALVGDPLDLKLFEATRWELVEGEGVMEEGEGIGQRQNVWEEGRGYQPATRDPLGAQEADDAEQLQQSLPRGGEEGIHTIHTVHTAMHVHTRVMPPKNSSSTGTPERPFTILRRFEFSSSLQRNMVVVSLVMKCGIWLFLRGGS